MAILLAALPYLRSDAPPRTRAVLLGLRVSSLLLLIVLLADLHLPDPWGDGRVAQGPASAEWILVDGSRALDVTPSGDPASPPDGAGLRRQVEERLQAASRAGAAVALLGPEPEVVQPTEPLPPRPVTPELLPALERLAEVGGREVTLVSPLRYTAAALERAVRESPVRLRIDPVGGPVRNAGVREIDLPRRVPAGEAVEGRVILFGERPGTEGGADTLTLEIAVDGQVALSMDLPLPEPGAPVAVPLELPPFPEPGEVRVTARVHLAGDAFSQDDQRVHRMAVGPVEGGVVLVSLEPDWEPRVLLPVLTAASGLEGVGFLRMTGDRWLPLGDDPLRPRAVEEVEERAERAEVLVIHGAGSSLPGRLQEIMAAHPRTLHLPAGPDGLAHAGLLPGEALTGEWMVVAPLPPSPVSAFLAGVAVSGLPPLEAFRVRDPGEGISVLSLSAVGREETAPGLLLVDDSEGRRAVALARGFWRWGHRVGPAREVYRSLWSGVTEWLTRGASEGMREGLIRPVDPVVAMDAPSRWVSRVSGEATIAFTPEGSEAVTETRVLRMEAGGVAEIPPLPPGAWRWEARLTSTGGPNGDDGSPRPAPGDSEATSALQDPGVTPGGSEATSSGVLEVEAWSDALLLPPVDPEVWAAVTAEADRDPAATLMGEGEQPSSTGRPLRTHPLPYLLILALLSLEWVGRRRAGLR